jgi:hypothetical protein
MTCIDCGNGPCLMNCGPAIRQPLSLAERAQRAVDALREPDASLARVPNKVRQSIADVIDELIAAARALPATIKDK